MHAGLMGAVLAALTGRLPGWRKGSDGFDDPHELDFLKGLGASLPGNDCAFLPPAERVSNLDRYPVPGFLEQSDYESKVNLAVTGNSGVGKSLFINTVRGVKCGDATWAPVGVGDTTKDPRSYEFPNEPRVQLWDLEGALTSSEVTVTRDALERSVEQYIRQVGLRYFDVVLILSCGRLTETETEVMQELQACKVPFFFVRTKMDWDIENSVEDYDMTPQEVIDDIRADLVANGVHEPYLLNARGFDEYDFPRLVRDILLVVNRRWPSLIQQSIRDDTPKDVGDASLMPEEAGTSRRCDSAMLLHPGSEPVEVLVRYTGRWYWVEDDAWLDYIRAEAGEVVAQLSSLFFSNAEHSFEIKEDGRWLQCVSNALTGSRPIRTWMSFADGWTEETEIDMYGTTLVGRGIEYMHEGCKLVSEIKGAPKHRKKGGPTEFHIRFIREVVDGRYIMTNQNLTKDISGRRIFAPWPYYSLVNETGKPVTMSTYSGWSVGLVASMTVEVQPGAHYVGASSPSIQSEKAVFSLGDKKLTIAALKVSESFLLREEDFT